MLAHAQHVSPTAPGHLIIGGLPCVVFGVGLSVGLGNVYTFNYSPSHFARLLQVSSYPRSTSILCSSCSHGKRSFFFFFRSRTSDSHVAIFLLVMVTQNFTESCPVARRVRGQSIRLYALQTSRVDPESLDGSFDNNVRPSLSAKYRLSVLRSASIPTFYGCLRR
ncbi:hypothetical protein DFJ43DRAFT_344781 [Lentinula guzmanii]|uniref:Uncharacterized protein n=1 Tax=Lentinula guzmanii TaxID=2804957 RepID=A0AA38JJS8_9AGAR|nr:hypothetical protein DFJ43DRAFT_344781 [Lentinula guzmanii]